MRVPYISVNVQSARPGRHPSAAEIVDAILAELRGGRLPPGCRLPPVRALELKLGISKNTVQSAYDELVARGAIEARERQGFYVRGAGAAGDTPPGSSGAAPQNDNDNDDEADAAARPAVTVKAPLPRLRPPPGLFTPPPTGDAIPLGMVFIDPTLLPMDRLEDCLRSVLRTPGLERQYGPQGSPALREAIARRLCARGFDVTPAEVLLTVGSQQALDVVARALDVGRVAVENPVYPHARLLFERLGKALTALPLDPFGGIDTERWGTILRDERPSLLYAITSFQNPTGYSYTSRELLRIAELAAETDTALLEDDWGSDMLSGTEYRPTLRQLAGRNVIYVNSFTKKLWPAGRVGYLVAPAELMPALIAVKRVSTLASPPLLEAAIAEFLDRGYYDTYLAGLQAELDARYQRCLELLRALMPDEARWTTPGGGPTLWLELPRTVDLAALGAALARRGVHIETTRYAFAGEPHLHGFRVSYAYLPPPVLEKALRVLADELGRALVAAR
jgi:DNA-binding transcriptional MocR family regulator